MAETARSEDAAEGDGYVVCMINNFDTELSSLVVLDTREFDKAVAMVKLPLRVRQGLHGNWVDHSKMHDPKAELVDCTSAPTLMPLELT